MKNVFKKFIFWLFHFPSVLHFYSESCFVSLQKQKSSDKSEMFKLFDIIYRAPLHVEVGESGDKNLT